MQQHDFSLENAYTAVAIDNNILNKSYRKNSKSEKEHPKT